MKEDSLYSRKNILRNINRGIKLSGKVFAVLIVSGVLSVPLSFVSPYLFGVLIDRVLSMREFEFFKVVVLGLLGVYLLRLIFDGVELYCSNLLLNRFTFKLRTRVFKRYLKTDYAEFVEKGIGDLKMRFYDDINSIGNFHKEQIVGYIVNILTIILSFGLTIYINWKLTLICLIVVPFVIIINKEIGKGFRNANEETRKATDEYYSFCHNSLQYWKEIKAMNTEEEFINRYKEHRSILARLGYKWIKYWCFQEIFNDFKLNYVTKIIVYIAGAFFVINQNITVGGLIIFSEYFGVLLQNIDGVSSKNVKLKINRPYYKRLLEIIDIKEYGDVALKGNREICTVNSLDGLLLTDVSFQYKDGFCMKDINLKLSKGDCVEITGVSGGGKSTLIKIMLNLYKPQNGTVYAIINGNMVDINKLPEKMFYEQIGVVMQDGFLFNMSIKENLLLARKNADYDELVRACEAGNIWDFIKELPEGFDTVIGENGIRLSGGQKQRIKIAQAFLKQPSIVIFDEATSSIDDISEKIILESIKNIGEEIIFIMVTHKPDLVQMANKAVKVEDGKIIQEIRQP